MYQARFRLRDGKQQPLREHILGVASLAESFGAKLNLSHTMRLAGLLHDMGKYDQQFQDFIEGERQRAKQTPKQYLSQKRKSDFDHGVYGAKYFFQTFYPGKSRRGAIVELIAMACCYHHGGLKDCVDVCNQSPLLERFEKLNQYRMEQAYQRFSQEIQEDLTQLFHQALEELIPIIEGITKMKDGMFCYHLLIKTIYSMLIDADRMDSMCFEENREISSVIEREQQSPAWEEYQGRFEAYLSQLNQKPPAEPKTEQVNRIRQAISEECFQASNRGTGIYRLTVPTGGGKTLSSMRFALNHNRINQKQRIVYVIPYTSIIEQNAEQIRKSLGYQCDLLEHHSNLLEDNQQEDYKLLTERWDSDIIFTTMVQFLNTFYHRGTQDMRRLHHLMNATIIFDEIQTLPAKCMDLFTSAANFLCRVGDSTLVLCTATQPYFNLPPHPIIEESEYAEIVQDVSRNFEQLKRVQLVYEPQMYSLEQFRDFLLERKQEVKSLLAVVNKVDTASTVLEMLEQSPELEGTKLFYLSTRLCPAHRGKVLEELKQALKDGEDLICVSTSLIEAGVDISFEAAVRSLTRLDSVAQTAGRVNRNGEREQGYCYAVKLQEGSYNNMPEYPIGINHADSVLRMTSDALSPSSIEAFFQLYYQDVRISEQFSYPLDGSASIYELLQNKIRKSLLFTTVKFQSAAQPFEVIGNDTVPVIVPYGEGNQLITQLEQLHEFSPIEEKKRLLSQLRKYSVNLYRYQFQTLRNDITQNQATGAYLMGSLHYDDCLGVTLEDGLALF